MRLRNFLRVVRICMGKVIACVTSYHIVSQEPHPSEKVELCFSDASRATGSPRFTERCEKERVFRRDSTRFAIIKVLAFSVKQNEYVGARLFRYSEEVDSTAASFGVVVYSPPVT